jgi:hypothetical protein
MKKFLIAVALLPFSVLTACAVYPDGHDYSGRYDRHDSRGHGDYRKYEHKKYEQHKYDREGHRGGYNNRDHRRGQGYYCPPGQEKKGRC